MTIVTPNQDGTSDCDCDGGHFQIAYVGNSLTFFGFNSGRLSSGGSIEYGDTEQEARDRVDELGLTDPLDLLDSTELGLEDA